MGTCRYIQLCCTLFNVVEKKTCQQYRCWQYFRSHPTVNRLGGGRTITWNGCLGIIFNHVHLATTTFLCIGDASDRRIPCSEIPMLPVVKGFARTKKSMLGWILFLFPLPFLLTELGIGFIVLATVLNIGWLYLSIKGFKAKDDLKWATSMFIYSLNYMTILFVAMIIFSIFI